MVRSAVIVTGLPASGKSTIARALATALGWPLLDKDVFLEALFDAHPVRLPDDRRHLSRAADAAFRQAAEALDRAILVSHWRPRQGPADTGTPTDWLAAHFAPVVEVHCICDPVTAAARFRTRRRHPGHLDALKSPADVTQQMTALRSGYPLDSDTALSVTLQEGADPATLAAPLARQIAALLASG